MWAYPTVDVGAILVGNATRYNVHAAVSLALAYTLNLSKVGTRTARDAVSLVCGLRSPPRSCLRGSVSGTRGF
jgi:hypothetical protein